MIYQTVEDVQRYAEGTFLLVAFGRSSEFNIGYCNLLGSGGIHLFNKSKTSVEDLGDPKEWKFKAPPLGNIQINNKCYYLSRVPLRREWKLGITKTNTRNNEGTDIFRNKEVLGRSLQQVFKKEYLSGDKALELALQEPNSSWAFSRRYAFRSDNKLLYCGQPVADVEKVSYGNGYRLIFNSDTEVYNHENNLRSKLNQRFQFTHTMQDEPEQSLDNYNEDWDV